MTPGSRVHSLIDILTFFYDTALPADVVLVQFYRDHRFMGSADRKFISQHFFNFFRNKGKLDGLARLQGFKSTPYSEIMAYFFYVERASMLDLEEWGKDSSYSYGEIPIIVQQFMEWIRLQQDFEFTKAETLNVPEFFLPLLEQRFSDDLDDELQALNQPAPLDLRVNTLKATREQAIEVLGRTFTLETTPYSNLGLRLQGRPPVTSHVLYEQGSVEIQDEGSQLISLLCGAKPGMSVLDLCAGAGGKTLALAAQMENKGRLFACDVNEKRLQKAKERFKRAGIHNVIFHVLAEGDKWAKRHAQAFDCVLVDVPCSGTGTWRRNPDAPWRTTLESIEKVTIQQQAILQMAAKLLKKGGRLVYSTCSLLKQENEEQIEKFLTNNPKFSLRPIPDLWSEVGTDQPYKGHPDYAVFTPKTYGTDGFFAAVLERNE